jgi:hypothetical protein
LGLFPTKCDVHYGYLSFTWNCPPGRKTLNPSSFIPVYSISFHLTRIFVGFKKEEGVEKSVSSAFVPEGRVDLPARQQALNLTWYRAGRRSYLGNKGTYLSVVIAQRFNS